MRTSKQLTHKEECTAQTLFILKIFKKLNCQSFLPWTVMKWVSFRGCSAEKKKDTASVRVPSCPGLVSTLRSAWQHHWELRGPPSFGYVQQQPVSRPRCRVSSDEILKVLYWNLFSRASFLLVEQNQVWYSMFSANN